MRRSVAALFSVAAIVGASVAPAAAEVLAEGGGSSQGVVADACREAPEDRDGEGVDSYGELTGQACDTTRLVTWNAADACWTGLREVSTDLQEQACVPLYGQQVSSAQIDDFEGGWVELAHRDQHRWAAPLPMRDRTVVATHNSYNSYAYGTSLSRGDANQTYTMSEQLRMGVRRLELDVHYFLDTTSPDPQARRPVLCHARETVPGSVVTEHTGCTVEFALADGLTEIDAWLDAHRDQFVMLRFENHLDNRGGYDAAAADVARILDGHLYTPPSDGGCHRFDTTVTAADVLATGTHVLAVSDCGPGTAWRGLIWDDGAVRTEGTYNDAYRDAFRAGRCPKPGAASSDLPGYPGGAWVRFYNDATWLSASSSRGPAAGPVGGDLPADATPQDAAAWMRCGVNQPSFDFLTPTDGRMEAMVWSWAEGENLDTGKDRCAVLASDGRFHTEDCGSPGSPASDRAWERAKGKPFRAGHAYLCRTEAGWAVTSLTGPASRGDVACATEFGGRFDLPRTAQESLAANAARQAAGADTAWLALIWDGSVWAA